MDTARSDSSPRAAPSVLNYFFSTLPPWSEHSFSLPAITKPLPLQAFWPLQSLEALLQALWPLHELPPTHFTCAPEPRPLSAAITELPSNIRATAVARTAPVSVDFLIRNSFSPLPISWSAFSCLDAADYQGAERTTGVRHCLNRTRT